MKVTQEPAEPISAAHKERFEAIRDRLIAELEGSEVEGGIITDADIFHTATETPEAPAN